jgi:hypothetical protein
MKIAALIILFTASFVSTNVFEWNPEEYHGISDDDVKVIFFDDFTNNKKFWKKSDFKKTKISIESGSCHLSAKEEQQIWQEFVMDKDGFELETSFRSAKPKSKKPLNVFICGSRDKMLTFSIFPDKTYKVSLIEGDSKKDFIKKTPSAFINTTNNKITIRKVDETLYFFINEQLTATHTFPNLSGYRYGFTTSKNDIVIDYFIMSDLVKDKRNADFNMKNGEPIDVEERGRYKM